MVTGRLKDSLKMMDISLLDHIILGNGSYYSFRESDLMDDLSSSNSHLFEKKDNKSLKSVRSIKENVVSSYSDQIPGIKHIGDDTARILHKMNEGRTSPLSLKEIKEIHHAVGKSLELGNNEVDLIQFSKTQKILDDFRKAQLTEKQIQSKEQIKEKPELVKINFIER
jgi:hypothetical protein